MHALRIELFSRINLLTTLLKYTDATTPHGKRRKGTRIDCNSLFTFDTFRECPYMRLTVRLLTKDIVGEIYIIALVVIRIY